MHNKENDLLNKRANSHLNEDELISLNISGTREERYQQFINIQKTIAEKYKYNEDTFFENGLVHLRVISPEEIMLNNIQPNTVHCFPFFNGNVLFTKNKRGVDIIGGHIEKNETAMEALYREAKEESSIIPGACELIGAIEVDNKDNPEAINQGYPLKGYQFFYKVTEFEILPFKNTHESSDRIFVSIESIPSIHHNWLRSYQHLLDWAMDK